jgi:hypothetical protein
MDPPNNAQNDASNATGRGGRIPSPPYGYHNSFHTHAIESNPPTYNEVRNPNPPIADDDSIPILPSYNCTVSNESPVFLRCEFFDPFTECPDLRWRLHYAVIQGTKLALHSFKSKKTAEQIKARKPVHTFSLQHAEVGLAVDLAPEEPMAKCALVDALPSAMRQRLLVTKPHLFGPKHEWILRLRLESFQFLLSFPSHPLMLDWVEDICAAIDISQPLEDRTYPRYRSLPRRSRRQRQLESAYRAEPYDALGLESLGQRLIQQQQRIINAMYPNLGEEALQPVATQTLEPTVSRDPDMDDLDPADIRESPYLADQADGDMETQSESSQASASEGSKSSSWTRPTPPPDSAAAIRYRRRCAPVMNKYSPRSSDIVIHRGKRVRIDVKRERLVPFELAPPRYPKTPKSSKLAPIDEAFTERFLTAQVDEQVSQEPISANTAIESGLISKKPATPPTSRNSAEPNHARLSSSSDDDNDIASVRSIAGFTIGSTGESGEPVSAISTGASSLRQQRTRDEEIEATVDGDDLVTPLKEKHSRNVVESTGGGYINLVL